MLRIHDGDIREDRYSRLRLIPWWDQEKIRRCKLLVVGAGALGNEILKNAALLGFEQVIVVDLDRIEESNLSRSILYAQENVGEYKADAAAKSYRRLLPGARIQPLVGNIVHGCGLGLFEWSDVILGGLDNREARLWINRSAWKVNRPWIDGAIEGINGVARVFVPGVPPCYECTLGEMDWKLLEKRMSCNLLALEDEPQGKVPTTPTISSVIAAIQVQEAVKLIHGMPTLTGKGYVFEGMNHSSYVVEYTENADCMSHYVVPSIVHLPQGSRELSLHDVWERACKDLGGENVVLEFSRDVVQKFACPACGKDEDKFAAAESLRLGDARCPEDGQLRTVVTAHNYTGVEDYGNRKLNELGLPLFDLFVARAGESEIGYIPDGDAEEALGPVAQELP